MSKIVLFDVDGTVEIAGEPFKPLVALSQLYEKAGYLNVVATGRLEEHRKLTEDFFRACKFRYHALLMRPSDDLKVGEWKYDAIETFLKREGYDFSDIEIAYENHLKRAKQWDKLGVPSLLVYGEELQ